MLPGQVVVELGHPVLAEQRTGDLGQPLRQHDERLGRVPQYGRSVVGVVQWRLAGAVIAVPWKDEGHAAPLATRAEQAFAFRTRVLMVNVSRKQSAVNPATSH
jgi:hypothetical protein